ncbi:MAG: isoprenylcysteine carboxylmethyltransferase family protein [Stellaceae bacterium]
MGNSASSGQTLWRIARFDLSRLQQTRAYDALMRLPMLAWSLGIAWVTVGRLVNYERGADPMLPDTIYAINIAAQLAMIAFLVTTAATVLARARPTGRARGLEPRLSALLGTFLIPAVALFPRLELSLAAGVASMLLILCGTVLATIVLARLGRSFSVMAEARELVTSGVYRYVRHPLYLAEEIATIGSILQYLSGWTAAMLAVQIAFQLRRMHNEEVVLMEIFPEYAAYKQTTARIIPGIY